MTEGTNVTHEATRLAEEAKRLTARLRERRTTHHQVSRDWEDYETAAVVHPADPLKVEAADMIDALAALAQPAPTAEVALPAVSEEAKILPGPRLEVPQTIIDQIGRYGVLRGNQFTLSTQDEWEKLIVAIGTWGYGLARAQSAAKGDAP